MFPLKIERGNVVRELTRYATFLNVNTPQGKNSSELWDSKIFDLSMMHKFPFNNINRTLNNKITLFYHIRTVIQLLESSLQIMASRCLLSIGFLP